MFTKIKKYICIALSVFTVFSIAGCDVAKTSPSNTGDIIESTPTITPTSGVTPNVTPDFTFSPLFTPTPDMQETPTDIPTEIPTDVPTNTPIPIPPVYDPNNGYYQYTLNPGNGKNAFAWTSECPVKSDVITFGTRNSAEVTAIQTRLSQLGFYCGKTSGTFNEATRTALNEFQMVVGLQKTSDITKETIDVLYSKDGIEAMNVKQLEIDAGSLEGYTIFIDAGHGAASTGTSRGSLVEKFFVLEVSYRLQEMLEKAGARVIMIRTEEKEMALSYRAAFTNYILLNDLYNENLIEIEKVNKKINIIEEYSKTDRDFNEIIKSLTKEINDVNTEYKRLQNNMEIIKSEYGEDSDEYRRIMNENLNLEKRIANLRENYDLAEQLYYTTQMNVDISEFEAKYIQQRDELKAYSEKLVAYRDLFLVNVDNPSVEFGGLYKKTYDENGLKVIEPQLKEIFDITGEKCTDKYLFISVHVNGFDGSSSVRGTEVYVRAVNSANNNYGINKTYYTNYCAEERNRFASCIKNGIDSVDPLCANKAAVIKESDLFVLREINIPCVLLETGYVTNESDRIAMQKPQNRYGFAYSMYKGISEYFNNK